jgi:putative FmdB family regulatory protein
MPTYEYACKSCGEHLEVVQSFKDDALTECPACGGALRKVFGNIGVTFKGSGFYKTDSRSEPRKAGAARSNDGSSRREASGDGAGTSTSSGTSSGKGEGAGTSTGPSTGTSSSTPASGSGSTSSAPGGPSSKVAAAS